MNDRQGPPAGSDSSDLAALARRCGLPAAHCDALSRELPTAVDSLWRRRAWEVPPGHLEDYVTLGWMSWNGGSLELTSAGRALHVRMVARRSTP